MITTRNLLAGVATAALIVGAAGAADAASITSGDITIENDQITTVSGNDFWTAPFSAIQNTTTTAAAVSVPTLDPLTEGTWTLTFSFVFQEAGWINSFQWDGDPTLITAGVGDIRASNNSVVAGFDDTFTVENFAGGVIPFKFEIISGTNAPPGVEVFNDNFGVLYGTNDDQTASFLGTKVLAPGFLLGAAELDGACSPPGNCLPVNQLYIAFDDGGFLPGGDDDNHDDLIILMSATFVPTAVAEPVTLGILGLGLAGIGLMARRRRLV